MAGVAGFGIAARAMRVSVVVGVLALAGCGGGGGDVTPANNGVPSLPATGTSIGPISQIAVPATPLLASGTTSGFHSSLTDGTVFPLTQSLVSFSNGGLSDTNGGVATLTLVGVKTSSGVITTSGSGTPVFLLTVPNLGLGSDANLPIDGTKVSLANGGTAQLLGAALNYTQLGVWYYLASSNSMAYFGTLLTGFQTPASGVPTSGIATYLASQTPATGTVLGTVFIPSGTNSFTSGALSGQASIGVNFTTGAVSGSLTGINANDGNGNVTPWNSVNLNGSLSGAAVSGTTSTTAAPANAGNFGFTAAATGKFSGALYGPNGQELGAVWTLNEAGGAFNGKSATGVLGATKQ